MTSGGYDKESLGDLPSYFQSEDEGIIFAPKYLVAGRFEIVSVLGKGGMGVVYLVRDQVMSGRQKVLKVIRPSLMQSDHAQRRFLHEAEIAQELAHPHIVKTYDLGEDNGVRFLTMEYLMGRSLAEELHACKTLPLHTTFQIINQVLNALSYAHQTTIHRDIKPQNIFLCQDGKAKLLDFGLARVVGSGQFTQSSAAVGTAVYMAPEQLKGTKTSPASDLYSLGVVIYECLTGEMPMGRFKMPSELRPEIPQWVDDVIDSLLSADPARRPPSAKALYDLILEKSTPKPLTQAAKDTPRIHPKSPSEVLSNAASPQSAGDPAKLAMKVPGYVPTMSAEEILGNTSRAKTTPPAASDNSSGKRRGLLLAAVALVCVVGMPLATQFIPLSTLLGAGSPKVESAPAPEVLPAPAPVSPAPAAAVAAATESAAQPAESPVPEPAAMRMIEVDPQWTKAYGDLTARRIAEDVTYIASTFSIDPNWTKRQLETVIKRHNLAWSDFTNYLSKRAKRENLVTAYKTLDGFLAHEEGILKRTAASPEATEPEQDNTPHYTGPASTIPKREKVTDSDSDREFGSSSTRSRSSSSSSRSRSRSTLDSDSYSSDSSSRGW